MEKSGGFFLQEDYMYAVEFMVKPLDCSPSDCPIVMLSRRQAVYSDHLSKFMVCDEVAFPGMVTESLNRSRIQVEREF